MLQCPSVEYLLLTFALPNCYVVNTSALGYLPPNEYEELLNINLHEESLHRTLPSISVKSMVYSPLSPAGYRYESSRRNSQETPSGSDWASTIAATGDCPRYLPEPR
jgi:hypothetical protein